MEVRGGLKLAREPDAAGVQVEDVGSSSKLPLSIASNTTLKGIKTRDENRSDTDGYH
jgi:hypothetical protein